MFARFAFAAAVLSAVLPAHAQSVPAPRPPVRVLLTTSEGAITVEVDPAHAPVTAGNFLRYVDQRRFDGTVFYRAVVARADPPAGFVQGGTQNDPKRILKPIAHEPTTATGLSHVDGAISMARFAPGTATGDFTIAVGPIPSMDANPAASGDNLGYAAFGHVVEGMDVVRRILFLPKSPTRGEGVMKGQMLSPTVRIVTARRVATPVPAAN